MKHIDETISKISNIKKRLKKVITLSPEHKKRQYNSCVKKHPGLSEGQEFWNAAPAEVMYYAAGIGY